MESNSWRKPVISMYLRRIQCRDRRWGLLLQPSKYLFGPKLSDHSCFHSLSPAKEHGRRHLLGSDSSRLLGQRCSVSLKSTQLHAYSSESDGTIARENKSQEDAHARLGEQDQEEWLNNKLSLESKRRELPVLTRRDKFKIEILRRIVPWEKINVSWDTFPYHIHEEIKTQLMEIAAAHLRHNKVASSFGTRLASSGRILLQSIPDTELYQERLVKALAQDLQVPLLVFDRSILAPYDIGDDHDNADSGKEGSLGSKNEDHGDSSSREECTSSTDSESDASDDEDVSDSDSDDEDDSESDASDNEDKQKSAEAVLEKIKAAVQKLIPCNDDELPKITSGESEISEPHKSNDDKSDGKFVCQLRKGDRVKYTGPSIPVTADDWPLANGQRGEVYEVNGDQASVILDINEVELESVNNRKPPIHWINVNNIEHDLDAQSQGFYIAMETLCEVLHSKKPLIVYFPGGLHKSVPKSIQSMFINKVQEMFDQLSGPIVLICGQSEAQSNGQFGPNLYAIMTKRDIMRQLSGGPPELFSTNEGQKTSKDGEINKAFNVLSIQPPKDENLLATFKKQLEGDRKILISRSNLYQLRKVLKENQLSCADLLHVDIHGVILTKQNAAKVVNWAKNHYLSSCLLPCIKGNRLCLPRESLEIAISRLRGVATMSSKPSQSLKDLAEGEYERNFISAVVSPGEIGVKFDDIGALEYVKNTLNELVILPMRRPELFTHGNLLRPCKGVLLFGPPGTGKTLMAKALATEAGANFISVASSNITSKWYGETGKLIKALFSFARKLAPVIIFVDEVDSLLGARGGASENETSRRLKNEFMAEWDGLRSKENQRILILGATNRPFDLDDAVIRRLPRRIYVDLPDAENRMKILRIILKHENLDPDFQFDKLANLTGGYSGSDLKHIDLVQELLKEEKTGGNKGTSFALRPLNLDDFIQSKSKVGPSVDYDAPSVNELRKWNEMYGEGGTRTKSPIGFGS